MVFRKNNHESCNNIYVDASVERDHFGSMTRKKFKAMDLERSEYFISFDMMEKSKSQTTPTTSRAISSSLHPMKHLKVASNLMNLIDFSISTKVNTSMIVSTWMNNFHNDTYH